MTYCDLVSNTQWWWKGSGNEGNTERQIWAQTETNRKTETNRERKIT